MTTLAVAEKNTACQPTQANKRRVSVPRYEIYSREGGYEILAHMPGVQADGLSVELENRTLTIKGSAAPLDLEGFKPLYTEFAFADYEAAFRIPSDVDDEKVTANLDRGVLSLSMPLRGRESKAIKVNVA